MNTVNNLGVNFGIDYAKYQSIKGDKGDFVDFLINYDSKASENGDESWMNSLFGSNDLLNSLPAEAYSKLDSKTIQDIASQTTDNSFSAIDTEVASLKLQLLNAFKTRYENSNMDQTTKSAKIASLYEEAQNIKLPSRLV